MLMLTAVTHYAAQVLKAAFSVLADIIKAGMLFPELSDIFSSCSSINTNIIILLSLRHFVCLNS